MERCTNINKFWLVLVSVALLLIVCRQGYTQCFGQYSNCHPGLTPDPDNYDSPSFHNANGLICAMCHTMHASEDGGFPTMPYDTGAMTGPNPHLLYKANATDLCLVCHSGPLGSANNTGAPRVMTPDGSMGTNYPILPGGDYYYSKTNDAMGHNPGGEVIGTDGTLSIPPGDGRGVPFDSANETCVSCHEPHGGSSANAYRLLKKKPEGWTGADILVDGYESHPGSHEGNITAGFNPAGPRYFYPPSGSTSGFAYWCGACHSNPDNSVDGTGFHGSTKSDRDVGNGSDWIRHPSDRALGSAIASNYTTTYDWLYPVSVVDEDADVDSDSQVFCLSCHRAHATEYANSTRWDNTIASGDGAGCNKCHDKGS